MTVLGVNQTQYLEQLFGTSNISSITNNGVNIDIGNFLNGINTENNSGQNKSNSTDAKGIRKLLKMAWDFLKSILTPNKTAKAAQTTAQNTANAVRISTETASQLANITEKAQSLMSGVLANSEELAGIITELQKTGETLTGLQQQLQTLKEQVEAKQKELEETDDPDKRAQLIEELNTLSGQIQVISSKMQNLQTDINSFTEKVQALENSIAEQTEQTNEMVSDNTAKITELTNENTDLTASGVQASVEGATDGTTGATGEGITTGLHAVAAGATATVVGAGVGATAETTAVKTGVKSGDLLGASAIELKDALKVGAQVIQFSTMIAANAGLLDQNNAAIISSITNFSGATGSFYGTSSSLIDTIGSANSDVTSLITTIGSIIMQEEQKKAYIV